MARVFLISDAALRATGLIQPGSLVRWNYRLKLPDNAASNTATAALIDQVRTALPQAGWEIRSRNNASPQLERTINRFTQFLTLVGLAALLVGGVGVVARAGFPSRPAVTQAAPGRSALQSAVLLAALSGNFSR